MRRQTKSRTPPAPPGRWRLLRHYLEMVTAMLAGMVLLGAALRGVLALAALHYPTAFPELVALEMAVTMSAGMVVWMRRRGHRQASTLEMTGAMVAPLVLVPRSWLGVLAGEALLVGEHLAMLLLRWLVLVRRRAEDGGPTHG
jgi:hypothetical protein